MLILGQDQAVAEWALARLDHVDGFGPCAALGFAIDGELKGAAVFSNLRYPSIELSLAIDDPRVCTRSNIAATFCYCFYIEQVTRVTALAAKGNKRSRKLIEGVGFKHEGTLREALPDGGAMLIYGMTKTDFDKSKWQHRAADFIPGVGNGSA